MYTYSVIKWLFFFYFYCFLGWCIESAYVSLHNKKLVNRGFMRGPFLPLYGSGGIMML
ncbi:MAG: putative ABC transporter permease, partial [Acetatifactor sp.]|nr:putative ABC transporter permease [Acetatifactor sp.]